jgi:hypothetical protein
MPQTSVVDQFCAFLRLVRRQIPAIWDFARLFLAQNIFPVLLHISIFGTTYEKCIVSQNVLAPAVL